MFVTLLVLKLERLRDVNEEQLENIEFMFVTLLVLKLERLRDVNALQPENIKLMFVTLLVLKLERLRDVNEEQLENIEFMFVTLGNAPLNALVNDNDVNCKLLLKLILIPSPPSYSTAGSPPVFKSAMMAGMESRLILSVVEFLDLIASAMAVSFDLVTTTLSVFAMISKSPYLRQSKSKRF